MKCWQNIVGIIWKQLHFERNRSLIFLLQTKQNEIQFRWSEFPFGVEGIFILNFKWNHWHFIDHQRLSDFIAQSNTSSS